MLNHDRYTKAVQQLAALDYEVLPNGAGYIVRHLTDANDVSKTRDLNDLIELVVRQCRFDNNAVFSTVFTTSDVSTRDYFHPSVAGQAKLAAVTWAASEFGQ